MKKEIRKDMVVYAVLMVCAIIVYFWIIPTQIYLSGSAKAEAFSPDTFPRFITIVFWLAAAGGFLNSLRLYRRECKKDGDSSENIDQPHAPSAKLAAFIPYIVFLLVLVYGILFSQIGFIAATAIVPPIILLIIGCRKWHYYLSYYIFAAVLYLLFKYLLLVPIR